MYACSVTFDFLQITPDLTATKRVVDGDAGVVRASGWPGAVRNGRVVAVTVLDEDGQQGWTRLVNGSRSQSIAEPLDVIIPRSSIEHRISVTASVMYNRPFGPVDGMEDLDVTHEDTCIASEESAGLPVDGNTLAPMVAAMPMSTAHSNQQLNNLKIEVDLDNKIIITDYSMFPTHWQLSVRLGGGYSVRSRRMFILQNRRRQDYKQEFDLPISFKDGKTYQVDVKGLNIFSPMTTFVENNYFQIICGSSMEFKAVLTLLELKMLHAKAAGYVKGKGTTGHGTPCLFLYRNASQSYFEDFFLNHGGLMKGLVKDNSGDPKSPINGRISGLFFMANVEPGSATGQPMLASAFGDTRLVIPAETLFQLASNLYFADFYCMHSKFHYVTLVMTRPGSETDVFCSRRLLPLSLHDPSENPFLFYDRNHRLKVSKKKHLQVELLFTENLDINQYRNNLVETPLIGKGQTTSGGVPKNLQCRICNLSPIGAYNPY